MRRQRGQSFPFFIACVLILIVVAPGGQGMIAAGAANASPTQTAAATSSISAAPLFREVHMVDDEQGWALVGDKSYTGVFRTQDGGQTWDNMIPPSLFDAATNQIAGYFFLDNTYAWITTSNSSSGSSVPNFTVWNTRDGGHSWQKSAQPLPGYGGPAPSFIDQTHGWLLLADGGYQNAELATLYQTTDGGLTWLPVADDGNRPSGGGKPISQPESGLTDQGHLGLAFTSAQNGWLALSIIPNGDSFDVLRHTTDGGKTWSAVSAPPMVPAVDLQECEISGLQAFPPASVTFLAYCTVTDNAAKPEAFWFRIDDTGQTWHRVQLPARIIMAERIVPRFFMLNATTGWLIGNDADTGPLCCGSPYDVPALYQTLDTGKTWTKLAPLPDALKPTPGREVPALVFDFVDDHTGWAVDKSGELLTTKDAGRTWSVLNPTFNLK